MTTAEPVRVGGHAVGLPEGVYLAPLGRRLAAFAIDALLPYVLVLIAAVTVITDGPGWLTMILYAVPALWVLLLWWMVATRAAGPGMRLLGLQVVGLHDGRPIGFARALLRAVIIAVLTATVVGLIVMATLMLLQARRQGWHDRAVDSVVIEERPLAPPKPRPKAVQKAAPERPSRTGERIELREEPEPVDDHRPAEAGGDDHGPDAAPAAEAAATSDAGPAPSVVPAPAAPPAPADHGAPAADHRIAPVADPVGADDRSEPPAPAAPPPDQGWVIILEDGREIPINRLVLIGRNPQPRPGEEDARLIKIIDEARTVSKTHLAINVDARGVVVTDRRSTNGSAVTDPNGTYELLTADEPRRIPRPGYLISFGKHHVRIGRTV